MFCPKCGNQLPDRAAFCTSCGSPMNSQPAAPSTPVMNSMPGQAPANGQFVPQSQGSMPGSSLWTKEVYHER